MPESAGSAVGRFEGRVALVTGGVSGIGAAVTRRLLLEGATVIAADIDRGRLSEFKVDGAAATRLDLRRFDVSDSVAVAAGFDEAIRRHERLDLVVANAAVSSGGKALGDVDDELWRRVLAVNVTGVFHTVRAALPHLEQRGGNVVVTASVSGLGGDYRMAAYNAAKGAVVNLVRSVAVDYGPRGVRANGVAPGPVRTPLLQPVVERKPDSIASLADRIPLRRVAEPEEVAAAIAFLGSDEASYISGVTLAVDGGVSAWTGLPDLHA